LLLAGRHFLERISDADSSIQFDDVVDGLVQNWGKQARQIYEA
jgi:hypothetical protein